MSQVGSRIGRTARAGRAGVVLLLDVALAATLIVGAAGQVRAAGALPFTSLEAGFTQTLIGAVDMVALGGVAFAPDGDPLVAKCDVSESTIYRFDLGGVTSVVHGSTLVPSTHTSGEAGCGVTNGPAGALYSNTNKGIFQLDATGAVLAGPLLPNGNAQGIAVDPTTGEIAYVGIGGTIELADAPFTATSTFSSATVGEVIDGITFDAGGTHLFLANATTSSVTILGPDGTLVQDVPLSSTPDGIAFFGASPQFLVTNNTDGTMTRLDFGGDFSTAPSLSTFAAGGFAGNLSGVGPDGCLFVTEAGTRYDDATETDQDSLVRICADEVPPPVALTDVSPVHVWIGLRNGDDQGTRFDIQAELLKNDVSVASGLTRCVSGATRNPTAALEVTVEWIPLLAPISLQAGDVLSLRLTTRIGTNPDESKCAGHGSAVGLRVYYDAASRPAGFDTTISPSKASVDQYLHSDGTACNSSESTGVSSRSIDSSPSTAPAAKCKDAPGLTFADGNRLQPIGVWAMASQP